MPILLQHFAILLKYVIHVAIPDIPTWVQEEMAKLDYQRREAFKVGDIAAREKRAAAAEVRTHCGTVTICKTLHWSLQYVARDSFDEQRCGIAVVCRLKC